MTREERIQFEIKSIQSALFVYPTILLEGPPTTSFNRIIEAIFLNQELLTNDKVLLKNKSHPDLLFLDGREVKPEEAREIRDRITAMPSRLNERFLVITYVDRLHTNAIQALLKLAEEPLPHVRVILITDRPYSIPLTIQSRSIILTVDAPTISELEYDLNQEKIEEIQWRSFICGGMMDVAKDLDVVATRSWHKIWSSCLAGGRPSPDIPFVWSNNFNEMNYATCIACWNILISLAAKVPLSEHWRNIAIWSMNERERVLRGKGNKIRTSTVITHIYVRAKTASKRK